MFLYIVFIMTLTCCSNNSSFSNRIPVAEVGKTVLYLDELPENLYKNGSQQDSSIFVQNYINNWVRKNLLLIKAEENISSDLMNEVDRQLEETRTNLLIHQFEKQLLLEKMDTIITNSELEDYYVSNETAFRLTSNIVKAIYVKLPSDAPEISYIKSLIRSNDPSDLQQLEKYALQYAEKYDDFNKEWVPMDRLTAGLTEDIDKEDDFLKRNTYYETSDSGSLFMISIRDYRLRTSLAPFDYVRNDIKKLILNNRRIELIQNIENGIYNDALKESLITIY